MSTPPPLTSRLKDALGSLSARLLVAFLLPTLLFLALTGTAVYALARSILEEELGTSLSAIAAATASQVSGERMLTIEPGDDTSGTRTWRNLVRLLTEVRDSNEMGFQQAIIPKRTGRQEGHRSGCGGSRDALRSAGCEVRLRKSPFPWARAKSTLFQRQPWMF